VGAQPLIGEDTCQQIFHSGRYPVSRGEDLRLESPEGRISGGDPGRTFKGTGVVRSFIPEDFHTEVARFETSKS
jgi:hypothetical protein